MSEQNPIKHGGRFKNLVGNRFGRLVVVAYAGKLFQMSKWLCRCDCGNEKVIAGCSLRKGATRSCGCLNKEETSKRRTTHGQRNSRLYTIWSSIIGRCENTKNPAFSYYGGRGISICPRWRKAFENFASDMGQAPPNTTLDRINNDGNYEPNNCRWASRTQQGRNKRSNHILNYQGQALPMSEWAELIGIAAPTIAARLKYGWSVADALTTQPRKSSRNYGVTTKEK